ncbi:MAG: DUF362 domain-containing protein [Methanobacteriota archaeon]|nr:MAG: DUF362 domain-containing protein [Euryarchaeota archaeon]
MSYSQVQDIEDIRDAVSTGKKYIIVFKVEPSNKLARLKHFTDSLDIFSNLKGKSCFVKPNIVSSEGYPTTTDPAVMRFVFQELESICPRLESGDCSAQGSPKDHQLADVASQMEIPFHDLKGSETEKMGKIPVYTYPKQFDSIVSLPILKEHFVTGITFATKNNFGFVGSKVRVRLHIRTSKLHDTIAKLHGEYPVDLVLGDACRTMRRAQEKRWGGLQEPLGLFFLSNAPLELDLFAWRLMPKRKAKHLDIARKTYGEDNVLVWLDSGVANIFQ